MISVVKRRGEPMRAIDADRLLEERRIHTYYHLPNGDIAIPLIDIKNAPTIEERKKGKWIKREIGWKCSNCTLCTNDRGADSFNFCPNCGADMRGDRDE